jgi:hypothetical protein
VFTIVFTDPIAADAGGPPLALLDQAATTCPRLLLALCDGATSG